MMMLPSGNQDGVSELHRAHVFDSGCRQTFRVVPTIRLQSGIIPIWARVTTYAAQLRASGGSLRGGGG
jgi:hypothetical protein